MPEPHSFALSTLSTSWNPYHLNSSLFSRRTGLKMKKIILRGVLWFTYQLFKSRRYFLLYIAKLLYVHLYMRNCDGHYWIISNLLHSNPNSMPGGVLHGIAISGYIWNIFAKIFLKKQDKISCVAKVTNISWVISAVKILAATLREKLGFHHFVRSCSDSLFQHFCIKPFNKTNFLRGSTSRF